MRGTYKECEVDDNEHRSGTDGAADNRRTTSTSIVITVSTATTTSTYCTDHITSSSVSGASADLQVRHGHRTQHSVVHHRFRRSRGETSLVRTGNGSSRAVLL